MLQPQGCKRLILVLHNLDLASPDKYATTQLHAFIHQVIEHGGYYDSQLAFTAVNNIQIVATAGDTAASTTATPVALHRSSRHARHILAVNTCLTSHGCIQTVLLHGMFTHAWATARYSPRGRSI